MKLPTLTEEAVTAKAVPGKDQKSTSKLNISLSFEQGSKNSAIYLFLGNVQFASNDFCHFQFVCMLRKHCCETVQSLLK